MDDVFRKNMTYTFKNFAITAIHILGIPLTVVSALWLKYIRRFNIGYWNTRSNVSKLILSKIGVFPITDHYYEPLVVDKNNFRKSLRENRFLPGIDWNIPGQLSLLKTFNYKLDLLKISDLPASRLNYSFNLGPFLSGDSEVLFNIIRSLKPKKIIEIGCGHSTLMMRHAVDFNTRENEDYECEHVCIEPYENNWLESLEVEVFRKKVEDCNIDMFKSLQANDILFIDSSHMIRPHGDVLFEFLEILPSLNPGVIIHFHDIFSPKDYLNEWIKDGVVFWNEQYLLEAFLSCNKSFEIIAAVNYLKHNFYGELASTCPMLTEDREPGSFWLRKV